jgi:hypothetical protein
MVDVASGGHHHPPGRVVAFAIAAQIILAETAYGLWRAENVAAQRMVRPRSGLDLIENQVVRRVLGGRDLLQDDAFFQFKVVGLEQRAHDDVGHDVQRHAPVILQDAGIVGGLLHRRGSVHVAACRLDLGGNVEGCPRRRSLERHVLEQVSEAILFGGLVARTRAGPYAKRHRFHVWHVV